MRLNATELAIRKLLDDHIRIMSYDPAKPEACACGWAGGEKKGNKFRDHLARKIHHLTRTRTIPDAECTRPSPHTIEQHHARGEALCKPCSYLLRGLQ